MMLSVVSAHILHLILETDFYLYSHNDCILQDFKATVNVSIKDINLVREMLCEYILKETIDRKGNFYNGACEFIVARNLKLVAFMLL
jgi:hypothetical protein